MGTYLYIRILTNEINGEKKSAYRLYYFSMVQHLVKQTKDYNSMEYKDK